MKKFLGTITLLSIVLQLIAQNSLSGVVTDDNNHLLKGATITIAAKNYKFKTQTDAQGKFSFEKLSCRFKIQFVS